MSIAYGEKLHNRAYPVKLLTNLCMKLKTIVKSPLIISLNIIVSTHCYRFKNVSNASTIRSDAYPSP